jgi:hypothetical protein
MNQDLRYAHTPGPWRCDVAIPMRSDFSSQEIAPSYVLNRRGTGNPVIPRDEAGWWRAR